MYKALGLIFKVVEIFLFRIPSLNAHIYCQIAVEVYTYARFLRLLMIVNFRYMAVLPSCRPRGPWSKMGLE